MAKLGEHDIQVVDTLHDVGVCLRDSRRNDEAEQVLRQTLAIENTKLSEEAQEVVTTLWLLGVCIRDAERHDEAEELLLQASAVVKV